MRLYVDVVTAVFGEYFVYWSADWSTWLPALYLDTTEMEGCLGISYKHVFLMEPGPVFLSKFRDIDKFMNQVV